MKVKRNVVIISIDGMRPDFYLESRFEAKALRRLAKKGAYAIRVAPIFPPLTYPCHTTLVTGVKPSTHGIISNKVFSWTKGPTHEWYWGAHHIQVPTLWQVAKEAGLATAAIRWPVTVGADIDWLIPEIFSETENTFEADMNLTVKTSTRGLLNEIFGSQRPRLRSDGKNLENIKIHDFWVSSASIHILKKYRPDLMLLHLIQTDKAQHESGRESPQVVQAVREIDSLVQRIVDSIDLSQTTLVIVGDHGFENFDRLFNVNALFLDQGWITVDECGILKDWSVIAQVDGGLAAVYLKDKSLKSKVLEVLQENSKSNYHLLDSSSLNELGAFPDALCALVPKSNIALSDESFNTNADSLHYLNQIRGHHASFPSQPELQTGYIMVGAGIKSGVNLGSISLLDVAPTLARLLNLNLKAASSMSLVA